MKPRGRGGGRSARYANCARTGTTDRGETERTRHGSGYGNRFRHAGAAACAQRAAGRSRSSSDRSAPTLTGCPTPATCEGASRALREIPAAALSNPDADLLHRTLSANKTARLRLTLGCRWLPDADSANVVGEIPGSSQPDEVVVLGAHLDSWDLGTGAIDDGAGATGLGVRQAVLLVREENDAQGSRRTGRRRKQGSGGASTEQRVPRHRCG